MSVKSDFLSFKSFPSSLKITNIGPEKWIWYNVVTDLPVIPGKKVTYQIQVKQKDVVTEPSGINLYGKNGTSKAVSYGGFPIGTYDWSLHENPGVTIPSDVTLLNVALFAGKGTTWVDDLKIFQDDVLIYSNDFSNYNPIIGAGVGAAIGASIGYVVKRKKPLIPALVGAGVGAGVGAAIGLFAK